MNEEKIRYYIQEILREIESVKEKDALRDDLKETPERVLCMYQEIFNGYKQDITKILKVFNADHHEMVIEKDIEFYSTCEHHMVSFFGKVHIGYIPDGKVLGLSKLARLTDYVSHRLQIQERITTTIAEILMKQVNPKGCMVVVEAKHLCVCGRGIKKQDALTITSAVRGCFADNQDNCRNEFLMLIR